MQDPDGDPGWGVPAVAFEVELTLEGVVDRLDDLPQGLKNRAPARSGSPRRAGRSSTSPAVANVVSNSRP